MVLCTPIASCVKYSCILSMIAFICLQHRVNSSPIPEGDSKLTIEKAMKDFLPRGIITDTKKALGKLLPFPTRKPRKLDPNEVPKYMLSLYQKIADPLTGQSKILLQNNSVETDTEASIYSFPALKGRFRNGQIVLDFDVSVEKYGKGVTATYAELVLYKRNLHILASPDKVHVEILAELGKGQKKVSVMKKEVQLSNSNLDYVVFEVSGLAKLVQDSDATQVRLFLVCGENDPVARMSLVDNFRIRSSNDKKPLLVVYHGVSNIRYVKEALRNPSGDILFSRSKRAMEFQYKRRDSCQPHPMFVDFSRLDWDDWIIAPSGYEARVCKGKCTYPLSANLRPSHHATIQAMLKALSKDKNIPDVCCVPSKMRPLVLLYQMDGDKGKSVNMKEWKEMIVDECACK